MVTTVYSREQLLDAGQRAGQAWMCGGINIDAGVIEGLERLLSDGERPEDSVAVFGVLYPTVEAASARSFWRRWAYVERPSAAFLRGFIDGALGALGDAKLRAKML